MTNPELQRLNRDELLVAVAFLIAQCIRRTPTFFVNGKRLENLSPDSLIAEVRFAAENS